MGEFSITHILIVLILFLVFFGPKRLPQMGQSLGEAIRGFKNAMNGSNTNNDDSASNERPRQNQTLTHTPGEILHEAPAQPATTHHETVNPVMEPVTTTTSDVKKPS